MSDLSTEKKETDDFNLEQEIAPLSTLSNKQPIEMNAKLRSITLQNDPKQNREIFNQKAIPWSALGVFLVALLFTLYVMKTLRKR